MKDNRKVTKEFIDKYSLKIIQPANGYRYTLDSFLLAYFVSGITFRKGIEFCAGCGIVSLLVHRMKTEPVALEMFEIQPELYKAAFENISNNISDGSVTLRNEDVKYILPSFTPELVYLNPPFRAPSAGRVSNNMQRAFGRHEFFLTLREMFQSFHRISDRTARLACVHLFERKRELLKVAEQFGLYPEKLTCVRPFNSSRPVNILVLFSYENLNNTQESFLTVYKEKGVYSDEMTRIVDV